MVSPISKPAPDRLNGSVSQVIGALHDDTPVIYVHQAPLEAIIDHAERDRRREAGGFLIGRLYQDRRLYIEVEHALPAEQTLARGTSLTFTHDTWSMLHRTLAGRFPHSILLGWYHTHLGLGVFLSGYDLFIQRHFFREPWQVALVVDPQRHEVGFFQWRSDQITDCGFIYVPSA